MRGAFLVLTMVLVVAGLGHGGRAAAQCRTACLRGEGRDPYGCCVPDHGRRAERRARGPSPTRPENLVGEWNSIIASNPETELYHFARAWLANARSAESTDRGRAVGYFTRAAGACLIFLTIAEEHAHAGRMRAVLVQALDGAGMTELSDLEASALGGARPRPEAHEAEVLRADTLMNLAWGHLSLAQRIDPRVPAQRLEAVSRLVRAADYFRLYVQQFPEGPAAPSAQTQLASALLGAGSFREAAAAFEELARTVPARELEGTVGALGCYERALAVQRDAGMIQLPDEPPPPSMRPPFAEAPPFPEALARLYDARERFLASPLVARDPAFARAQALENALWLYRFARFREATPRLARLLTEACDDDIASEAFRALSRIESQQGNPLASNACEAASTFRCSSGSTESDCVAMEDRPRPDERSETPHRR